MSITEPWPFRDAIQAAINLQHEAFACMEGADAEDFATQEKIERACVNFIRALKAADPVALGVCQPHINWKGEHH